MSWQGNEVFVSTPNIIWGECEEQMIENLKALFDIYECHGNGWYLLGDIWSECEETEDDYCGFDPKSHNGSAPIDFCWLPNPFMHPPVVAIKVRRVSDLLEAAFEAWDNRCEIFAYAGDGDEPLERMEVYGDVYDMRPEAA